jgi:hypothetical protein
MKYQLAPVIQYNEVSIISVVLLKKKAIPLQALTGP